MYSNHEIRWCLEDDTSDDVEGIVDETSARPQEEEDNEVNLRISSFHFDILERALF